MSVAFWYPYPRYITTVQSMWTLLRFHHDFDSKNRILQLIFFDPGSDDTFFVKIILHLVTYQYYFILYQQIITNEAVMELYIQKRIQIIQ